MKGEKLNILFRTWRLAGSWKHVPCHISRILPDITWWRHVAGGWHGVFLPAQATHTVHCVSAISRRTVQTRQNLWCHNRQALNVTFPHTVPSTLPPWRTSVNQSINQAKRTSIAPYFASESDASHCAQRPPTTNASHSTTACCQFDHELIIGYGNSNISYEIIFEFHIHIDNNKNRNNDKNRTLNWPCHLQLTCASVQHSIRPSSVIHSKSNGTKTPFKTEKDKPILIVGSATLQNSRICYTMK